MDNRRRAERIEFDVLVNFTKQAIARAKNINELGMCIVADNSFPPGVLLNLVFSLPHNKSVEAMGRVVWFRKIKEGEYENGIEFYTLNPQDKDAIISYVQQQLTGTE